MITSSNLKVFVQFSYLKWQTLLLLFYMPVGKPSQFY